MKLTFVAFLFASTIDGLYAFQAVNPRSVVSLNNNIPSATAATTTTTSLYASNNKNNQNNGKDMIKSLAAEFGSVCLAAFLAFGTTVITTSATILPAYAESSKVIGELKGSGLVFKDTLLIERFEDPKVKGVTLYISNFDRPITEKLSKNFFNDPSYASVGCAKTGPVAIADNISKDKQGEEVFEENRSLLFKSLRVQRIYDVERNTMVYVSFNTRLDKNDDTNKSRFKSSLCAVSLDEPAAATPVVTPAEAAQGP